MRHHHHLPWLLASVLVVVVVPAGDGPAEPGGVTSTPPLILPSATIPAPTPAPAASTTPTIEPTTPPSTTRPSTTAPPPPPPAASGGRLVYRGDPTRRLVALTFDAGSDTGYTSEILDILEREGIRATFGLTGRWTESAPDLARRIAAEGHQLVNHSYNHPSFTGRSTATARLTATQRADQLVGAERAIAAATGQGTAPWWRPPYGDVDDGVVADAAAAGWPVALMWTIDSLGWKGIGADAVEARCLAAAEPGAIILLHVGAASDDAAALPDLIAGLRTRGYGFATVAEIAG